MRVNRSTRTGSPRWSIRRSTHSSALDHKDINAAVRAARDLLDRAGLAAPKQTQMEHSGEVSLLDALRRIEAKEDAARGR